MQTSEMKNEKKLDTPISTVSTTQTDYGSTTATESNSYEARFSTRRSESGTRPQNTGFNYQSLRSLSPKRKSSTLNQDTRFPSFVNLPAIPSGHFRTHPMDSSSSGKHTHHPVKIFEQTLNVVSHVCIGFVTIYMSWLCLHNGLAGTALHAWLVTIGFVLLMAEGIMCHYTSNVLTLDYHRNTKTRIHWILQAAGGSLGMLGALIKMVQKGFLLQSTHGQLGFAAFLLCFFSMLSGLSALYSMRLKHLLGPLLNKSVHNVLGFVTFFIAILAQFYGYQTGYFMRHTESDFRTLMRILTIILLALSSIGPLKTILKKSQMLYSQYFT